ncbi:MAG: YdgA family protein, partial [Betaproteobacteria bacterium]|nr:YdgA family protein [Betaproteobacteria bacterium]
MKKLALVLVALLVLALAAAAGTTFYFSRQAEQLATSWPAKIEEAAAGLKAAAEYQRGFLSSTQRMAVTLPGAAAGAPTVVLKSVIHHGPLPAFGTPGLARIDTTLELEGEARKFVATAFGGAEPVTAVTHIALDGSGTTTLTGAPAQFKEGASTVSWQGFSGTLRFTPRLETYAGEIVAPRMGLTGLQGGGEIKGIAVKLDQRRMPGIEGLYLGKMAVTIERVAVKDDKSDVNAEALVFESDATNPAAQFIDVAVRLKAAKVSTRDIEASGAEYAFSLKHLHAPSFQQLNKAMSQVKPPARGAPGAPPDTAALMAQMGEVQKLMKTHGLTLLQNDPVLAIDRIQIKLKEGELKASGTLRIPGVTAQDIDNPFTLLPKIDAQAEVTIPEAFARNQFAQTKLKQAKARGDVGEAQAVEVAAASGSEFAQMLGGFVEQGYVESRDGQLTVKAAFKGGELT